MKKITIREIIKATGAQMIALGDMEEALNKEIWYVTQDSRETKEGVLFVARVNEVLAGIFGMRDWEVFADGCGRVGEVEPITVPELARKAQAVLGGRCNRPRSGPAVQVKFADTGKTVKRLAVISGAGGSMFEDALAVGADCLLTGEANHHAAIDAVRLGLSLVAAGHYATEFPVCAAIADRLRTAFPELGVRVSGENRDPFTYI